MTTQVMDHTANVKLESLPAPVQRYVRYTGMIDAPAIRTARIRYTGKFRLGLDKPWMTIRATQTYTTNPPGFDWRASFRMFGVPLLSGRDRYQDGDGHMFGKLAGLFTVFDVSDDKLLQGTMVRYLQEAMWFPTAYLEPYITWHAVDDHTADATFKHAGKSVTGRFYFDDDGRILSFSAERYAEDNGTYTLRKWSTPVFDYATFGGLRIPSSGQGVWDWDGEDFVYIKMHLTDVVYNG